LSGKINNLHYYQTLIEGFDDPDISVGIILGTASSEIKAFRKGGRLYLKIDQKIKKFFILSLKKL